MPAPLTQAEMDLEQCGNPDCPQHHDALYIMPSCHNRAGLTVLYTKATGVLSLACMSCGAPVGQIKVAPR